MLTYYIHDGPSEFRFRLVGALAGSAAMDLEQCWLTAFSTIGDRAFVVDIDDLTGVDESGRDLLVRWRGHGLRLIARTRRARMLGESILGGPLRIETDRRESPGPHPFRLALGLPLVLLAFLFLPVPVWASVASAGAVLDRYQAQLEERTDRGVSGAVDLDIDASLPTLSKHGHLKAIRRPGASGKPEYEVVRSEGDGTVRRQVIARYLAADAAAQAMPSSAVAISRANYKFHFVGQVGTDQSLVYVFQIKPRKKRLGMIQGELWIDAATGVAVHHAGHLVKRPSMFLRRVNVVQDTDLREGRPRVRITRVEVDTLLLGRAELTITEHPGEDASRRDIAARVVSGAGE